MRGDGVVVVRSDPNMVEKEKMGPDAIVRLSKNRGLSSVS